MSSTRRVIKGALACGVITAGLGFAAKEQSTEYVNNINDCKFNSTSSEQMFRCQGEINRSSGLEAAALVGAAVVGALSTGILGRRAIKQLYGQNVSSDAFLTIADSPTEEVAVDSTYL